MSQALPYSLEQLQNAFGHVESSNRYDEIGPETRRGNNAYGRYQVMDFNVPSWSEQYYGQRLTPQEFLANPQAQDAVFYGRMGEYYSQGQGAPEDRVRNAASLWFTGQPYSAETANRSDGFINNQEYGNRILRALGSAPQGASEMTMDPNPPQQPRGFLGGIFGGQQRQPDPNAGSPTDPFANLSRAQRTMLGFAALRDAAASLEGRDSNYFNSALGGFEAARERERLRAQGEMANRINALQSLAQIEALARYTGDPALAEFAAAQRAVLLPPSGGGVTSGVTTGATPPVTPAGGAPGAGVVRPADQVRADLDRALDPETGGLNADGTPFETPELVVTPSELPTEAAPTLAETPAPEDDPIAGFEAQLADIARQRAEIQERIALAQSAGVVPIREQAQLDALDRREDRIYDQMDTAREAQAAEEQTSAQQAETESRVQPLVGNALDFLVNEDGSINVLGARIAQTAPGLAGGEARLAAAAVTELGSIAAMQGVREAREGGFGGSLSDADILLIQRSGGTFDLSQPEATVETLRRIANQLSPEAQQALFGSQNDGGGENRFVPTDEDLSILERNL